MNKSESWGLYKPNLVTGIMLFLTNSLSPNYFGKRIFFALRKVFRRLLGTTTLDVIRLGAKLRLHTRGNVCEGRILFNQDFFDYNERKFLRENLPDGSTFIDAGANIGGYSFEVASNIPNANVISIEAHPEIFAKLEFNIKSNPSFRIKAINCALSDKAGEIDLHVSNSNAGEHSTKLKSKSGTSLKVEAKTLLDIVQECEVTRIDALKIDIEGAEDEVLKAFFETARPELFPSFILIEKSAPRWNYDVIGYLIKTGYRVAKDFKNNLLLSKN